MDADRYRFLFGSDEAPEGIGPGGLGDEQALFEAIDDAFPAASPGMAAAQAAVAQQILGDEPPQVWATAQRLLAHGLRPAEVMEALADALVAEVQEASEPGGTFDPDRFVASLDALPAPSVDAVLAALVEAVVARRGVTHAELLPAVLGALGRAADDRPTSLVFDRAVGEGLQSQVLALLDPDGFVHLPTLADGAVLTHRLTAIEVAEGVVVSVARDLPLFAWIEEAPLASGGTVRLDEVVHGVRSWSGPEGWFDGRSPGALVAVRVVDGVVHVDDVPEPALDDELVAAVATAHAEVTASSQLPTTFAELAAAVLLRRPSAFATPQRPLTELVERAGLDADGDTVASGPEQWARLAVLERTFRLGETLADPAQVEAARAALDALEAPDAPPEAVRAALRALHDDEDLFDAVADELLDRDGDGDVEGAMAAADRAVATAVRPAERGVAHWLAALVAERTGEALDAEVHVKAAVVLDVPSGDLVDRAGWYASDRGEAAEAVRWWSLLESPDPREVALVGRYARSSAPKVGRNDPCWCGSGRKFKVCHQGVVERVPLPERVEWLWAKATGYLTRRGGGATDEVFELAFARAVDPDDRASVADALADPIVTDLALVEEGWFAEFLEDRGPLLPHDEAALCQAWLDVARTVYTVEEVAPGTATVRDLRSGERRTVTVRDDGRRFDAGTSWCGRAVPDGEGFQFVGALFEVPAGAEREALAVLARGETDELCAYVARRHGGTRWDEVWALAAADGFRPDDPPLDADS